MVGLRLDSGFDGSIVLGKNTQKPIQSLVTGHMNRESFEVVATPLEPCAETVFLRARDIPDDLFQHADPELFSVFMPAF